MPTLTSAPPAERVEPEYGTKAVAVEPGGADPIPLSERHGRPRQLLWMWTSPNLEFATVVGAIAVLVFGLSYWQAVAAILLGNGLGALFHGVLTTGAFRIVVGSSFGYTGGWTVGVLRDHGRPAADRLRACRNCRGHRRGQPVRRVRRAARHVVARQLPAGHRLLDRPVAGRRARRPPARAEDDDLALLTDRSHRNWAGPIAMITAAVVSIALLCNQTAYVGLLARAYPGLGGLTFEVGIVLAFTLYAVLRPRLAR